MSNSDVESFEESLESIDDSSYISDQADEEKELPPGGFEKSSS